MVSRICNRVDIWGLPSPRSIDTRVLTATPDSSETVRWFTPSAALCFLMASPISFRSILPICCDFRCKSTKFFETGKIKSQYGGILSIRSSTPTPLLFLLFGLEMLNHSPLRYGEINISGRKTHQNTYCYATAWLLLRYYQATVWLLTDYLLYWYSIE